MLFRSQRDVERVTAGHISPRGALVIVQAHYDKFKVEQFVKDKAGDIETETYLGRVICTGKNSGDMSGGVSFIDNLIVAGTLPAVKQAIDRMAAPAPSVVDGDLIAQIRTIEASNQIWAVGNFDPSMLSPFGNGAVAKAGELVHSLKSGAYQMRIDQDVHVKASGVFTTPEMAKASFDLARGVLGMAQLQVANQDKLKKLLDGLSIESNGQTLTATFNASGDLLKQIQETHGEILKEHVK